VKTATIIDKLYKPLRLSFSKLALYLELVQVRVVN